MSYLSGFMMGAAIGKGIHRAFFGANESPAMQMPKPTARLQSRLEGRRRYIVSALVGNRALCEAVEKSLQRLAYVTQVTANPVTGSLLIVHEGHGQELGHLMHHLARRVFHAELAGGHCRHRCHRKHQGYMPAKVGHDLSKSTRTANEWLKQQTAGYLDFTSLFALLFLFVGLRKFIMFRQIPSGAQLLWWGMSLLRGWKIA